MDRREQGSSAHPEFGHFRSPIFQLVTKRVTSGQEPTKLRVVRIEGLDNNANVFDLECIAKLHFILRCCERQEAIRPTIVRFSRVFTGNNIKSIVEYRDKR